MVKGSMGKRAKGAIKDERALTLSTEEFLQAGGRTEANYMPYKNEGFCGRGGMEQKVELKEGRNRQLRGKQRKTGSKDER